MNRRQREVAQSQLDDEKALIAKLEKTYRLAQRDIQAKIERLDERADLEPENLQTIIHQRKYQDVIAKQIDDALADLLSGQYSTVDEYIKNAYQSGYLGAMYDIHGQGVPVITPINQDEVVRAIKIDSKLSKTLYAALGEDVAKLKERIKLNLSRMISQGKSWTDAAKALAQGMNTPYKQAINYALRIARTEGHRVQNDSAYDAMKAAKEKGADVVKQWDSTLDGSTRPTHRKLDGQIREIDDDFEVQGHHAKSPGRFGRPEEDINCRCRITQRAKWALDDDELETLKQRAKFYGLDKTEDFEDFKKKYLKAAQVIEKVERNERIFSGTKFTDTIKNAFGAYDAEKTLEVIYDKLDNCPVPMVENLWRRHFHDFEVEKIRGGAHYMPATGRVSFSAKYAEGKGGKRLENRQTFFHEVGHGLDDWLNGKGFSRKALTDDGSLGKIIFSDWEKALEKNGPEKQLERLNEAWKKQDGLLEWLSENEYIRVTESHNVTKAADYLVDWVFSLSEPEKEKLRKVGLLKDGVISRDWILTATKKQRESVVPEYYWHLWDFIPKKATITATVKRKAKVGAINDVLNELRKHDRDTTASLSDWLECLTGQDYPLGFGHGKSYWTRRAKYNPISKQEAKELELGSEAFAELFEMCIGDPEAYELTKKYFPNAVEWFEKTIKEHENE